MWKAALFLALLFVAGHFAIRYLRINPLEPLIEGRELAVLTTEHEVSFALAGSIEATYLVAKAERGDFGELPVNAMLSVVGLSETKDYLHAHPGRSTYGSMPDLQLASLSTPLGVVAANRPTYADLLGLIDRHADRVEEQGEWLCVTISGEELRLASAEAISGGRDSTSFFERRLADKRVLLVNGMRVEDCAETLASH